MTAQGFDLVVDGRGIVRVDQRGALIEELKSILGSEKKVFEIIKIVKPA